MRHALLMALIYQSKLPLPTVIHNSSFAPFVSDISHSLYQFLSSIICEDSFQSSPYFVKNEDLSS